MSGKFAVSICLGLVIILLFPVLSSAAEAQGKRPNILFAIADDASWKHFSAYGCQFVRTPAFDRVAKEGVLFSNAFTPTSKCSPSRAALLTGRNPWQLEEAANHYGLFPKKFDVFPDLLEKQGYFVGFTGKGWGPGEWKQAGWSRNPCGPAFNRRKLKSPREHMAPNDYAGNFRDFLDQREKDQPFCFWYGGHEPHRGYVRGSGVAAGKKPSDATVPPYLPDEEIVRNDILDYGLEIEHFDDHLGKMLAILETAGELENTLIVVTSDNGMPFPRVKGHTYEDACHMPLAIRWGAKARGGRVVEDFVSLIDVAPTLLDAAGAGKHPEMTGQSLASILSSEKSGQVDPARDHVLLGRERCDVGRPNDAGYPVRAIRTKEFFYARNFAPERWPAGPPETGYTDIDDSPTKSLLVERKDQFFDLAIAKRGAEELYDVRSDPAGVKNLADDPKLVETKEALWAKLEAELREQKDPRILGQGEIFETYKSFAPRRRSWDAMMQK